MEISDRGFYFDAISPHVTLNPEELRKGGLRKNLVIYFEAGFKQASYVRSCITEFV